MIGYDDETAFADQPDVASVDLSETYVARLEARMNEAHQAVDALAWRLTAALSAERKDAVGYRTHNAANPDGGQNAKPGELAAAIRAVETYLAAHTMIARILALRSELARHV